jgi:hypothetical protein
VCGVPDCEPKAGRVRRALRGRVMIGTNDPPPNHHDFDSEE